MTTEIDPIEAENVLLSWYEDSAQPDGQGFLEFVGLPLDASWGQFRRHYDADGMPDIEKLGEDLASFHLLPKELPN